MSDEPRHPDLQPVDERTALTQRLDQYRATLSAALADLAWEEASTRPLPATDLTIAGLVVAVSGGWRGPSTRRRCARRRGR